MLYKTEAVILTDSDLGDQDKVITLFSKNYGKVKAVAKGARRLKSRFSPAIQMLSYVTAVLYESERMAMDTLNECEINSSFLGIRKDLLRLAYGYYVAELIMKFVQGSETPRFSVLQKPKDILRKSRHIGMWQNKVSMQISLLNKLLAKI